MNIPTAIIFINAEINDGVKSTLQTQLHLDEIMDFEEFNARVSLDPNYPTVVHLQGYRIMVVVPNFRDYTNRTLADLVLFYNQGQVVIEKNKFGPPGLSLPIQRINIFDLLRAVKSQYVTILPPEANRPCRPNCNCHHGCSRCLGGIVVDQLADASGVHCPNPDNIYNNPDFINRK